VPCPLRRDLLLVICADTAAICRYPFIEKKLFPVICANKEDKQCRGQRDGRLKVEDEQCT